MPNPLQLSGAQSSKPTRFAPIYTGRWSSGIWTNRSPLRDANTTRISEKFYGPSGDALIAGNNVEITNRLTLARRPGNSVFDANTYTNVSRFDEFRLFDVDEEQINIMIDQANALYAYYNGTKSLVWTKSAGAGNTYMQPVGNSLYFGNGKDNKKWLRSLAVWSSGASWNGVSTPYMTTFIVDSNNNIQQLTGTAIPIVSVAVAGSVVTVTSSAVLDNVLTVGLTAAFPSGMTAAFMSSTSFTVTGVSGNTFTTGIVGQDDYATTAEPAGLYATIVSGGTPISGSVTPTWSTVVLTPGMPVPTQALTYDGTVRWTNRGSATQNWGIQPPTVAASPQLQGYRFAWAKNTFYSLVSVIIDSNGNLQEVIGAGVSGASTPTWGTNLGVTTTDGGVTWLMVDSAAPVPTTPAATPTFAPVAGTYAGTQTVTISCTTPSPTIYYTTDGSTPTQSSAVYTTPLTVSTSQTLQAVAIASSFSLSAVGSASYIIGTTAAPPTFSPIAGAYSATQTVTISDTTPAASIYYTLDGSTPTTSSTLYTAPLTISATTSITAIAHAAGYTDSSPATATYTISGSGGGYGGGGGGGGVNPCFNDEVDIKTPEGFVKFGDLPTLIPFTIVNRTGTHLADLVIHDFEGPMIEIGPSKLVTLEHAMADGDGWISAEKKYKDNPRVWFKGRVYNLHVRSDEEEDKTYILFNGDTAHNFKANPN